MLSIVNDHWDPALLDINEGGMISEEQHRALSPYLRNWPGHRQPIGLVNGLFPEARSGIARGAWLGVNCFRGLQWA
jgi:hypothetical protein